MTTPASAEPTEDDWTAAEKWVQDWFTDESLAEEPTSGLLARALASQRAEIVGRVSRQLEGIAADMEADDAEYGRTSAPYYARRIREAAPK